MIKRIGLGLIGLLAGLSVALAQQGAFPNYPIVSGAAYCAVTTNGVCTQTIPAGPTGLTGNEQVPANTELANGQQPQTVLLNMQVLNQLPTNFVTLVLSGGNVIGPSGISASNISGGVFFNSPTSVTITSAAITLPASPVDGQRYRVSSNRTITTLSISAGALSNIQMGANVAPSVLTASTTAPQGYEFFYNLAANAWFRWQ